MTKLLTKITTVLAIDTSCDETAAAVVVQNSTGTESNRVIVLSNVVASQVELHKPYGGVFPTVAKQAHKENIDQVIALALKRAKKTWPEINIIAVTQGPGLAPALEVGIAKAKELAVLHQKPLIAVNHIEGHVLSVLAQGNSSPQKKISHQPTHLHLPALSIVVSGGHTEFVVVSQQSSSQTQSFQYQRLGWTIDDAAGEALDKVGRILNLGYPAGPVIEQFAKLGDPTKYEFPLPMTTSNDYNLSYSGLKTFARRMVEQLEADNKLDKHAIYDLCASFQRSVFRHICHKLSKVLQDHPELGEVWLGGGVAANASLRSMLRSTIKTHRHMQQRKSLPTIISAKLQTPYSKKLCGDNAAMIGVVAVNCTHTQNKQAFERLPSLTV